MAPGTCRILKPLPKYQVGAQAHLNGSWRPGWWWCIKSQIASDEEGNCSVRAGIPGLLCISLVFLWNLERANCSLHFANWNTVYWSSIPNAWKDISYRGGQNDRDELGSIWKQFLLVHIIFKVADFPKLCILLLHQRLQYFQDTSWPVVVECWDWQVFLCSCCDGSINTNSEPSYSSLSVERSSSALIQQIPAPPCGCTQKLSAFPA